MRREIERIIEHEGLRPGRRVPSEPELVARYRVSRGTVREAFKLLEEDGVLDVVHGSGRYVSAHATLQVERPVTMFESVTEMLGRHGYEPTTRVLSVARHEPTDPERAALGLPDGGEVVRLERLRLLGDRPIVRSVDSFSATLLGGRPIADRAFSRSLCGWLGQVGRRPVASAAEIRAALPPDGIADDDRALWLLMIERCVDEDGAGVLLSENYCRGDLLPVTFLRRRTS
jgi:GntR family transcriptional regulator